MTFSKLKFKGGKLMASMFILLLFVTPVSTQASTNTIEYQPQTAEEMIAYLYGRISQLLEIKAMIEQGDSISDSVQSFLDYVSVDTHSATEVEETTAYLRGEVNLFGEATASAWFEYGQDDYFLDQKTRKVSVRTAYERAVRTQVRNLEEDERYYFRIVAENKEGTVQYGPVYSFRTDEAD